MMVNTFFEEKKDRLLEVARRFDALCAASSIGYTIIGGLAVYLHIDPVEPLSARLTTHVDAHIDPASLSLVERTAAEFGFTLTPEHRLITSAQHNRVHLYFQHAGFNRPTEGVLFEGLKVAPLRELLLAKLTRNKLIDKVHVRDMIEAGMMTPELECDLDETLRERLEWVKAHE
jgi:hypothetical protein